MSVTAKAGLAIMAAAQTAPAANHDLTVIFSIPNVVISKDKLKNRRVLRRSDASNCLVVVHSVD
jgi:hypothetical protein